MTGRERFARILAHKPVDRIGLYEQFWRDTENKWTREGKIRSLDEVAERFSFDIAATGGFNCDVDPAFIPVVLREDTETVTRLDGNGAVLRTQKHRDGAPEHIGFTVTCRRDWEEMARPFLTRRPFPRERLARAYYLECRCAAQSSGRALVFYTGNVFSFLTSLCASQVISNVPAALLLSGFTSEWDALIVGTNLGGLGTLIASMASLISYKFFVREHPQKRGAYVLFFTGANLLFLAVLLPAALLLG